MHYYLHHIPFKMYPLQQVLSYNPARTPGFLERINGHQVIMRCVILTAAQLEAVFQGQRYTEEVLVQMSDICSLVSEQLKDRMGRGSLDLGIIECICAMAIGGVS